MLHLSKMARTMQHEHKVQKTRSPAKPFVLRTLIHPSSPGPPSAACIHVSYYLSYCSYYRSIASNAAELSRSRGHTLQAQAAERCVHAASCASPMVRMVYEDKYRYGFVLLMMPCVLLLALVMILSSIPAHKASLLWLTNWCSDLLPHVTNPKRLPG